MRVGLFATAWRPEDGGGHTFEMDVIQSLSELASESPHEFVLFAPSDADIAAASLRTVRFRRPRFAEKAISRLAADSRLVRQLWPRPDYIERAARAEKIQFVCMFNQSPARLDTPYLTVVWDLQHRRQPWFPEVSADGEWDRRENSYSRFLRRAAIIVTGNEAGRDEIERFYQVPRDRIVMLPHPTPRFALDAPAASSDDVLERLGVSAPYLLYPAQFWAHKNHVGLVHALAQLRDRHDFRPQMVFVGSEKGNCGHVRAVAEELGVSEQVVFPGFVPLDDLVQLYRRAVALTYVSYFGPENLPPLEAFALGCPVVASNVPGAEWQIGDAGLLVEPRQWDQIADAIWSIHSDPKLRARLVDRGRKRAAAWTSVEFVEGVFAALDEFDAVRSCWES